MLQKNIIVAGMLVSLLAVTGCQTQDAYTGESKVNNTTKGAGIGALSGAALGALVNKNDRGKGALIGAGVGAASGAGIGYYMDNQEKALRTELMNSGVQVQREGDNIRLVMPGNITFASNSAELRTDFYPTLDSITKVLKKYDKQSIRVTGHTDSTGKAATNQTLSQQRAQSVELYLARKGVPGERLSSVGMGSSASIADNKTNAGKQANRRVEMELHPTGQ